MGQKKGFESSQNFNLEKVVTDPMHNVCWAQVSINKNIFVKKKVRVKIKSKDYSNSAHIMHL